VLLSIQMQCLLSAFFAFASLEDMCTSTGDNLALDQLLCIKHIKIQNVA
jgi:hypothetical protein